MNDEPYVQELRLLLAQCEPLAPKAARLRPLLPRIIQRLGAGAPRKVIIEQLNRAGLAITLHDLAKQLQRYRKAQRAGNVNTTPPIHSGSSLSTLDAAARAQSSRIESPADLRKLRHMEVDLDALRREGEAMRRLAKSTKNASANSSDSSFPPRRLTPKE